MVKMEALLVSVSIAGTLSSCWNNNKKKKKTGRNLLLRCLNCRDVTPERRFGLNLATPGLWFWNTAMTNFQSFTRVSIKNPREDKKNLNWNSLVKSAVDFNSFPWNWSINSDGFLSKPATPHRLPRLGPCSSIFPRNRGRSFQVNDKLHRMHGGGRGLGAGQSESGGLQPAADPTRRTGHIESF